MRLPLLLLMPCQLSVMMKTKTGTYKDLAIADGLWYFKVKLKDGSWHVLGGLSGETPRTDAEKFAQNTADSWRKK